MKSARNHNKYVGIMMLSEKTPEQRMAFLV